MNYKIEKKISSNINHVKIVVDDILQRIQDVLSDNTFFNTKLILNELIINGVKHGNLEDENKFLTIDVCVNNSCIIIKVTDEGSGICYNRKGYGEFDFCNSGRGLMLVENISDSFDVCGSTVTCVQYIK